MAETIWEEKNLIEPMRKSVNKTEFVQNGIIYVITKESCGKEWTIIGNKKKWIRRCPKCDILCFYVNKTMCYENTDIKCRKCTASDPIRNNKIWTEKTRKLRSKLSKGNQANKGRKLSVEWRKNISSSLMGNLYRNGKKMSLKSRRMISESLKGRVFSDDHKRKMRESTLNYLINCKNVKCRYNKTACEYFTKLNEEKGWNGIHAENGGEKIICGYSLDYYDPTLNIVVEYDEKHHYDINGNLRPKDIKRQNEIIKTLHCKFYRYNTINKVLTCVNK